MNKKLLFKSVIKSVIYSCATLGTCLMTTIVGIDFGYIAAIPVGIIGIGSLFYDFTFLI